MAEALVLGKKHEEDSATPGPTLFANLLRRPGSVLVGYAVAGAIRSVPPDARKGRLRIGDREHVGSFIRVVDGWGCAGLLEPDIAEAMLSLESGRLNLARTQDRLELPLTTLGELGKRGLLHRDLSGRQGEESGQPRGPFDVVPIIGVPTYPGYGAMMRSASGDWSSLRIGSASRGRIATGERSRPG